VNDAQSAMVIPLRSATADSHADLVAFLFTDIEASSLKWLNHRAAMQEALRAHDEILRKAILKHGGEVFKTGGDAFNAAFRRPSDAVGAAIDAEQALASHDWSAVGGLAVRMAVHVGTAERREGDYFGPALNRVARLLTLGHGGQVLVTSSASELIVAERENVHALRLLGTHTLDDPLQPVAVYQVDVPNLPHEFPPLRTTENRPTNLPRQPTPLIGRDAELGHVSELLTQHQMVTVTGTGGVGKTRITLEAGAKLLDRFPDGVWLVELAAISDASLVPGAVTTALGIDTSSAKTPLEAMLSRLRHQDLLLLLDNCEHVIEAAAAMVEALLAVAPKVRVLVSSQEPLGIAGEHIFRLPSLSVPKQAQLRAEEALREGAVQLFVDRAKAVDRRFALDDRNASTVAAICRRLDGIALAIEMAAARAPMLGVDKLAQKLDERFRVLTGGRRTALPRQQTLRATLDWSYGLLSERERTVLRRLAIFAGGFTLEGAGSVAGDDAIDEFEVIDILSHLVARSLVVADTDEGGGTRYRLLETTRAYALEKLAEAEESAAIERRHAMFFRDLFDRAYGDWYTLPDVDWCNAYLPERDNLRNALDWAFGPHGEPAIGIEIAGTSHHVWWQLSLIAEVRQRMEGMAPHVDESVPPKAAGRFWLAFGRFWMNIAPIRTSEVGARAAALLRQANLPIEVAYTLASYVRALPAEADFESQAEQALAEAWPLVERAKLPRLLGLYFSARGYRLTGSNPALAREHLETALRHWRAAGAEGQLLNDLGNLADITWSTGDVARAVQSMREALALVRSSSLSNRQVLGVGLGNLAGALTEQGEIDEAVVAMREAVPLLCESGTFFRFGDHFALRLAKAGSVRPAARLLGYTDSEHERFKASRQVNEARAHASLHSILSAAMAPGELASAMAEGAKLGEDEAVKLALTDR
jgi:predicted ATPase/class 3 adenylate cyclase